MNSFKPGLVSKNFDVALWSSRLLSKLSFLIAHGKHKDLRKFGFEWFVS